MIPEPWHFALLALAAHRTFWLIAEDAILDRPRAWLTRNGRREKTALFLSCPWCAGFWLSLAWWLAWLGLDEWALAAAVPFALSTLVGASAMALRALAEET